MAAAALMHDGEMVATHDGSLRPKRTKRPGSRNSVPASS
eukprot:COSAG05_NODE_17292_length_328_cov_0.676856_1_plen_38_part_01